MNSDAIMQVINLGLDLSMIFAPVSGYVSQYRKIESQQSQEGFSTKTSLILLLANCMRVFYWYGERFQTVLLVQSLVMILAQLVMLHVSCRFPRKEQRGHSLLRGFEMRQNGFLRELVGHFWQWEDFGSYVFFVTGFNSALIVLTMLFGVSPYGGPAPASSAYFVVLSYASLLVEACLPLPQLLNNMRTKSTRGLSTFLILTWLLGDAYKTVYFVVRAVPVPFILCGAFQLAMDLIIIVQIMVYDK